MELDKRIKGFVVLVMAIMAFAGVVVSTLAYLNDRQARDTTQDRAGSSAPDPGQGSSPAAPDSPVPSTPPVTDPTSEVTDPTPDPPSDGPVRVIFRDSFGLRNGEGINLDAGRTRIQRGVTVTDGDSMDLYVNGHANGHLEAAPQPDDQGPFFKTRGGTVEDCTALIERGEGALYSVVPETTSNLRYCFLTSEGHVAVMRVGAPDEDRVPVSVTVWSQVLDL